MVRLHPRAPINLHMENTSNHYIGNFAQKAILEKNGKILVCRGVRDDIWEFPGGRLHREEDPAQGLIREIKEELNIDIKIEKPVHICRSFHNQNKSWQIIAGFTASIIDDSQQKVDTTELETIKWITKEELKNLPMFDDCRKIADVYLNTKGL